MSLFHKVVFVGDSGAGKTSIINKFTQISGTPVPTITATSVQCIVHLPEQDVTLNVWDTAGQDDYKCLIPIYAKGAMVAVIVFDKTSEESFNSLRNWVNFIRESVGQLGIIVVGNKEDLPAVISFNQGIGFADQNDAQFIETSAETGTNVDLLFSTIANLVLEQEKLSDKKEDNGVDLKAPQNEDKKKGCCK
ncbi:Ras family protein [Histomonas meleagridis]|uniref:Ras family protein n=1 Tax=Histomonas meleagridis TaxID=135588 RepID=UPI00355A7C5C|nr:Ras family protein [Histomonas meleagridis]KAH0804598.1 Ras family protein [Histomonas meleagridis]